MQHGENGTLFPGQWVGGYLVVLAAFFFFFFVLLVLLFRATLIACGCSRPRGQIGAAAAGLRHSHSNEGSETHM